MRGLASWLFLSACTLPGILFKPSGWVAVVTPRGLGAFLVVVEGDSAARLGTGWPFTMEGGLLGTAALLVGLLLIAACGCVAAASVWIRRWYSRRFRHQRPLA